MPCPPTFPVFPASFASLALTLAAAIPAQTTIGARILGVDGKPLAGATVDALFAGDEYAVSLSAETDADGKLRLAVPAEHSQLAEGTLLLFHFSADSSAAARLTFAQLRAKPERGDIRLETEPVLVAGKIVDSTGKPIPDQFVMVDRRFGGNVREVRIAQNYKRLMPHATSAKDGTFTVRGTLVSGSHLRLLCMHKSLTALTDLSDLQVGQQDLVIQMARVSQVHGRFVGLRGMSHFPGRVVLVAADSTADNAEEPDRDASYVFPKPDGSFELSAQPGRYILRVYLPLERDPIHVIENIVVRADKPCRDPRLGGLDLTKHLRVVKLTIRDAAGAPLVHAMCGTHSSAANGTSSNYYYSDAAGIAMIPVPTKGGQVSIFDLTGHHQVMRFPELRDDRDVQLQAAWPLHAQLTNLPALPQGIELRATIEYGPGGDGPMWGRETSKRQFAIDAAGRTTLAFPDRGEFVLSVRAYVAQRGKAPRAPHQPDPPLPGKWQVPIRVEPGTDGKPLAAELEFDAGQIEQLKKLQAR